MNIKVIPSPCLVCMMPVEDTGAKALLKHATVCKHKNRFNQLFPCKLSCGCHSLKELLIQKNTKSDLRIVDTRRVVSIINVYYNLLPSSYEHAPGPGLGICLKITCFNSCHRHRLISQCAQFSRNPHAFPFCITLGQKCEPNFCKKIES